MGNCPISIQVMEIIIWFPETWAGTWTRLQLKIIQYFGESCYPLGRNGPFSRRWAALIFQNYRVTSPTLKRSAGVSQSPSARAPDLRETGLCAPVLAH